ncbi:MAG: helix-turn-helix domain-containing protein [Nitrososphaeria archaeon]
MITDEEFIILDYLDTFKIAEESTIKDDTGYDSARLSNIIKSLSEKGLIERFFGDQWKITKQGENIAKTYREQLLEKSGKKELFLKYCEEFEELNKTFKELVTRWQMKEEDGALVPNDHKDPAYDFAIIEQMGTVHERNKEIISKLSSILPFYNRYIPRFEKAFERLTNGELGYMDRARDSYHNIWFELHESLLRFSGMQRIE